MIHGIQNSDLKSLFNPENTFISKDGGGAGNNWASGFTQGEGVQETLLDMIGEGSGSGHSWCSKGSSEACPSWEASSDLGLSINPPMCFGPYIQRSLENAR